MEMHLAAQKLVSGGTQTEKISTRLPNDSSQHAPPILQLSSSHTTFGYPTLRSKTSIISMHRVYMDDEPMRQEEETTEPILSYQPQVHKPALSTLVIGHSGVEAKQELDACSLLLGLAQKKEDATPVVEMAAPSAPMSVRLPSISALLSALPSPTSSNAHHLTQQSPHFQSPHQRHVFHGMHKKSYSVDSPAYFRNSSSSVQPVMPPPQAPIHQRSQSHLIYNAPVTPTHRKTSSMDSNGSSISSAPSTPYLVGGPSNSVDSSPQTTMPQIQYRYHPQQHPQQPHNGVTYVEIPAPLTERQLPGPMYPREQQSQYAPSNQQPPQFHHAIHRRVHHVRTNSAPVFASSPSPVVINTNQQQGHRHQIIVPPSAVSASHRAQHRPHNVPQNRMEQDPQIALFRQEQRMHQERLQQQQQHQALQQQYHQQTQQQSTTQHSAPVTRVPSPIRTQLEPDSVSSSSPSSDDDANYNESPDKDEDDGPVLLNANGNPIKRRLRANREQLRVLESVFVKNKTPSPAYKKELAAKLGMPHKSILYWFQNRRAQLVRQQRQGKKASGSAASDKQDEDLEDGNDDLNE